MKRDELPTDLSAVVDELRARLLAAVVVGIRKELVELMTTGNREIITLVADALRNAQEFEPELPAVAATCRRQTIELIGIGDLDSTSQAEIQALLGHYSGSETTSDQQRAHDASQHESIADGPGDGQLKRRQGRPRPKD